jgi:hypothetical protein
VVRLARPWFWACNAGLFEISRTYHRILYESFLDFKLAVLNTYESTFVSDGSSVDNGCSLCPHVNAGGFIISL